VTGFEGEAIGRAEYLYEATTVLVASETKQAAADARWIPEARLEPSPPGTTGFSR
jgi:hypothetical protein